MKQIQSIHTAAPPHMVGDGFRVSGYINRSLWPQLDPFLMLDYMAPWQLHPTEHPRGVDVHPHKGFETVTLVWEGVLAHADSTGATGTLQPGDVQWMTAGAGILHKEYHDWDFSRKGGTMHMAQLWINLPAAAKNLPPNYQDIRSASIPEVPFNDGKLRARIIAGSLQGVTGPARTQTPLHIFDVWAAPGASCKMEIPEGQHAALVLLQGTIEVGGATILREGQLAVLQPEASDLYIETNNDVHLLLLSGVPLNEPIAAFGPFVMNTQEEIQEALRAYRSGAFGQLA